MNCGNLPRTVCATGLLVSGLPLASRFADAFFKKQTNERFELADAVSDLFQIRRFRFRRCSDAAVLEYTQRFTPGFYDLGGNANHGRSVRD